MAELEERLSSLLGDEQSMSKVLELASAIRARKSESAPPPAPEVPPAAAQPTAAPPPDLNALLGMLAGTENTPSAPSDASTASADDGSRSPAAALAAVLPALLQALSGSGQLVRKERADLVRAMEPYLSERRAGSLDRALRMANVTKAAKSALQVLGKP